MRASVSQRVNASVHLTWSNRPIEPGRWTDDVLVRVERNVFFRFFGIGPDTLAESETSYTRVHGQLDLRRGINLGSKFNVGARLSLLGDNPIRRAVPGLPNSQDVFPTAPGMNGAAVAGAGLGIRYDSRSKYEFAENGFYSDFGLRWFYGLANSPNFARFEFEAKGLLRELDWLQLGARFYGSFVSARDAPFYYQSSLGGSFLMRGFTEDRFIDRGAWSAEVEQRIRLFETHIYGVTAAWRIDPFIAVGQVFSDREEIFSHVRIAEGFGLRAFVKPNVLGRVDFAIAGEGVKVYVELGYPF
jgi:outer membrane protein assembly factor BamA